MVTRQLLPKTFNLSGVDESDEIRRLRGSEIADRVRIKQHKQGYKVPSQSENGSYIVNLDDEPDCTCQDYERRGQPCKHIYAVQLAVHRDGLDDQDQGAAIAPGTQPIKYGQNWPAYNQAQMYEGELFHKLLRELCDTIEQPPQQTGRPRLKLADVVFTAGLKVYSQKSGRRAMSEVRQAEVQQQLDRAPSFSTIMSYFQQPVLTPLLETLIEKSALPLQAVEQDFAIDSSGFSTSVYHRWYDHKWGRERKEAKWIKAHIMCGVKTNIVTAVKVTDAPTHDTRYFEQLLATTADSFHVEEVSGDKAYLSKRNLAAVEALGAQAYIPFKVNSTSDHGHHKRDLLWEKAYHYYHLHREDFLAHYHKRSNVETAFSMIKLKFGGAVRSKSTIAQINEVLVKVLCHNICVLIQSMYELGGMQAIWSETLNSQN